MGVLHSSLERLAEIQRRNVIPIFAVALVFTIVMGFGLPNLKLQTDFMKELPQDLPIMKLNERIKDKFSGQDTMVVILTLDNQVQSSSINDIRDPEVIRYLINLEDLLNQEADITGVSSAGTFLRGVPLDSPDIINAAIENSPASGFISSDYQTTVLFASADVGQSDERIMALDGLIKEKVASLSAPPGVKVMVTGNPQIIVTLFDLLGQDAVNTILYASVIILILLFIIQRSMSKGILVFMPLALGLVWTYGTMGWMGIKISIATAGLGAIILGLGVEYGVFMLTRYQEERDKGCSKTESLKVAVPAIGSAVIGSGTTTIIGFAALMFSIMPMLQNLGFSLALGIFYSLSATVLVMPIFILIEEKLSKRYFEYRKARYVNDRGASE